MNHKPLPGEITMKQWRLSAAARLGVTPVTIAKWLSQGKFKSLKIRRINSRVIFVKAV